MMWSNNRPSNDHILIACGVTLGVTLGFILGTAVGFSKNNSIGDLLMGSKPENWRLQWETLLGGLLALAAAVLTVLVMRWQTYHLIKRKERATKAMLPLYLASLIEYSESCLKYLRILKGLAINNERNPSKWNWMALDVKCPEFPDKDLSNLKEYIENCDEKFAIFLEKYVATLQVQRSGIRAIQKCVNVRGEGNDNLIGSIRSSMVHSAEIYKSTENILEFSRGHVKNISNVTSVEIQKCLWWFIHFDYESDSDLKRWASEWTPLMDKS